LNVETMSRETPIEAAGDSEKNGAERALRTPKSPVRDRCL
jgi:hypothetical protein